MQPQCVSVTLRRTLSDTHIIQACIHKGNVLGKSVTLCHIDESVLNTQHKLANRKSSLLSPLPPIPPFDKYKLSALPSSSLSALPTSTATNTTTTTTVSTDALPMTCPVCFEDVNYADMYEFVPCAHRYCKECIKEHLKILVSFGKKPFCLNPGCQSRFPIEMAGSLLDPTTYERYSMLLRTPPGAHRWCPRPGCDTPFIKADASSSSPRVTCKNPNCALVFCYECRVKWHEGESCEQYKAKNTIGKTEEEALSEKYAKENFQECPQCSIWVEKIDGCAYVQCFVCHHEFCWDCLEPHDHNMSSHVHGPRYKRPPPPKGYRRRRAVKIAKYAGFGVAVCVLGPPALAVGAVAATFVLPVLAVRKINKIMNRKRALQRALPRTTV